MRATAILVSGLLLLPSAALAQRLEAGGFVTHAVLERIGSSDHDDRMTTGGLGARAVWHIVSFVDLEVELAVHPNAGVQGYKLQGFLGAKAGVRSRRFGGFVKLRPGFLYFSKDPFGLGRPGPTFPRQDWARSVDAALDVGGVIEYYTPSRIVVRFDLGDTIVRYHPRTVAASGPQPARSVGNFTTRNMQWSVGVGKRF